ncbi:MAG: 1-deoxy-D-xylulose-5-phosphate reductoisomerase, partial [Clostridia bacterium]|nr:1-deoxy-D-xylulose-5-phosphate reductoisomerase [Clostridia bacterium]
SMKAQLSTCDMKIHIQYALTYPKRASINYEQLDLTKQPLEFFKIDLEKFKCLKLAYMAVEEGGTIGTVINAVNDVCVEAFLNGKIKFTDIASIIERVTNEYDNKQAENIDHILEIDSYAKTKAKILEENI